MLNRQEILDEINKTKEHLANMEKMLEKCEYERWRPKANEKFWLVDSYVYASCTLCLDSAKEDDDRLFNSYNCFKTKEEAETEAEKILIRRQLEDIARRLNKGQKMDWNNFDQNKYCIFLDGATQLIERNRNLRNKLQGVVYCLSEDFFSVAIQEIGAERLKKYLRGE